MIIDFLIYFSNYLNNVLLIDKYFFDVIDFLFFKNHYQPMPVRWLIIDTLGNVSVLSYSVVSTEEVVSKTLESIAGNKCQIDLFLNNLTKFCIDNNFDLKSPLLVKIFAGIKFLAKLEKPSFDYKKRLVFPERKYKAIVFLKVIKEISHSITMLVFSDREYIKSDENKFNFFKFFFLYNRQKLYTTGILTDHDFYKFYNGFFS